MGLERGKKIPGYIERQAKEAKLGSSDFYAGPTVVKRANRGEMATPEHRDDVLEEKMLKCENAAGSQRSRGRVHLVQRLQGLFFKRHRPRPQRNH